MVYQEQEPVSIYATLWNLKFPKDGWYATSDADWVEVCAQAVPAHIGHPRDYPEGDPYADFLPPVVDDPDGEIHRAVVFVTKGTRKEIQRYVDPLLVLTGEEYDRITWIELWQRLCRAIEVQNGGAGDGD